MAVTKSIDVVGVGIVEFGVVLVVVIVVVAGVAVVVCVDVAVVVVGNISCRGVDDFRNEWGGCSGIVNGETGIVMAMLSQCTV